MATRSATVTPLGDTSAGNENTGCVTSTWTGLLNGDDGSPVQFTSFPDRAVQVTGTFGVGGNLRLEGSIDGTNYAVLTDPQGNNLDFTAAKIEAVTELVRYIRPRITAGDGTTTLVCTLIARKAVR